MRKIIVLCCALLVTGVASLAQSVKLEYSLFTDLAVGSYLGGFEVYDQWIDNFDPPNDAMDLRRRQAKIVFDPGFCVEPVFMFSRFRLGVPLYVQASNVIRMPLSSIDVEWWNTVKVTDVAMRKTPAAGLACYVGKDAAVRLECSVAGYSLWKRDFKGKDVSGGVNTSRVFHKELIERGVVGRVAASYSGWDQSGSSAVGMFGELLGPDAFVIGLYGRLLLHR